MEVPIMKRINLLLAVFALATMTGTGLFAAAAAKPADHGIEMTRVDTADALDLFAALAGTAQVDGVFSADLEAGTYTETPDGVFFVVAPSPAPAAAPAPVVAVIPSPALPQHGSPS